MANIKRNSQDISTISTTTTLTNTSPAISPTKYPQLHDDDAIVVNVHEPNNNIIAASKPGVLQCLPEMFTDIDLTNHNHKLNNSYINGDLYKSYIMGKCRHYTKYKTQTHTHISKAKLSFMTILIP